MSTTETTTRPAEQGEVCDCGQPAKVIYQTERHGDVPSCGVQHQGDDDTGERVVVIPEITVSVQSKQARERVLELIEKLWPELEELHAEAVKVRDDSDAALVALHPVLNFEGELTDEMFQLAFRATGFEEVYAAISRIGDLFSDGTGLGTFDTTGLSRHEIARGGERDFPVGTEATVPRSDGLSTIRAQVKWGPHHPLAEGGYVVVDQETGKQYVCTHEQIKEGLESVPGEKGGE